jgi:hypothetical protein
MNAAHQSAVVWLGGLWLSVGGCYASHQRGEADAVVGPSSAIEIGTGCDGFEALPRTGGVVGLSPHWGGGFAVCAPIRVMGLAPGGVLRGEAVDPFTGELVAEPRFDEPYRIERTEGDWEVTGGTQLVFATVDDPEWLYGFVLLLRATAASAEGDLLVDEREVVIAGPPEDACARWQTEIAEEYAAIRFCTDATECGQNIPILCGCTRNPVARLDADITRFLTLLASPPPPHPDGSFCELPRTIPGASTCDCPPSDGYICRDGGCDWNLL